MLALLYMYQLVEIMGQLFKQLYHSVLDLCVNLKTAVIN